MRSSIAKFSIAAVSIGFITISTATASPYVIVQPLATGIGFGELQFYARRNAVAAWQDAVRKAYGDKFASFGGARSRKLTCARLGSSQKYRHRQAVIGTRGDPNAAWSCTARAQPVNTTGPAPRPKANAIGIGYGITTTSARGLAIRAWAKIVKAQYGSAYSNFNTAISKNVSCDMTPKIGRRATSRLQRSRKVLIGYEGNPSAPWTCRARGLPYRRS